MREAWGVTVVTLPLPGMAYGGTSPRAERPRETEITVISNGWQSGVTTVSPQTGRSAKLGIISGVRHAPL